MKVHRLFLVAFLVSVLSSCSYLRIDPMHVLVRSDIIMSLEDEAAIVRKASLSWSDDGRVRVLVVRGSPYERGYQHGYLLRREVKENLQYLFDEALGVFRSEELFAEAFERLRPFIPQEYIDEMHGLAHGAKIPLKLVHYIHVLPEMSEWDGKKRLKNIVKQMMSGELGTSCSNLGATPATTKDGEMLTVRVLDWGLHKISKLHEFPLLAVNIPDRGYAHVNVGWVGFLGAVSGMNEHGITLGEMGYGGPPNETLRGETMPFLLRRVLTYSQNLSNVRSIISSAVGTNSYVYVMSDGKTQEAEMYVRDRDRFLVYGPGQDISDGDEQIKGLPLLVYGGHNNVLMGELLEKEAGSITPEFLMNTFIPQIAMRSNFHNVIYKPSRLHLWVSNAAGKKLRAAEQPYTFFDFRGALADASFTPYRAE